MTELGTLGTDPCSRALMSNAKRQIVGTTIAICGYLSTHAFLSESGGLMVVQRCESRHLRDCSRKLQGKVYFRAGGI
jgi:hypothetical protein